ncbi:acetyl-CoA carboxylase biotin carboxyl carrier protein [Nocardia fluminea]|uniref:acetyl-CoA carboxylase biotin carboxyl carrier protein n=1 Tax=Nocardia fluminea TaxID=134984 RepID=UPI003657207E
MAGSPDQVTAGFWLFAWCGLRGAVTLGLLVAGPGAIGRYGQCRLLEEGSAVGSASSKTEGHVIASPFDGTFYRSANSDAPPFVDVGSQIDEEATVCVIDANEMTFEIESDIAGTVVQILVGNGDSVAFEQPLMVIRPR